MHEFRDYPKTGLTAPPSGSASGASSSRKKRLSHLAELLPGEPFRPDYVYTMLHKIRSNLSYKVLALYACHMTTLFIKGLSHDLYYVI